MLKSHFSKIKIIARGTELKAIGEANELLRFETTVRHIVNHFNHYHKLDETIVTEILQQEDVSPALEHLNDEEVIIYSATGKPIKARTPNQVKMLNATKQNDMVFAIGPAGTGKTYTAVALAVKALKQKEVKRIILTRPAVEAGERLGFLPGEIKDKLDPYLQPLYDALFDMIPGDKLSAMMEKGIIQIAPLAFMRGRTLDDAFVILDEAQNATQSQLKMFLTRMGQSAKFFITGDMTQVDLPRQTPSGLLQAVRLLDGVNGISIIHLNEKDVVRHKLVKKIIQAYQKSENL